MQKPQNSRESWVKLQAFLVVRCGMSIKEARTLEADEIKAFYDEWMEEKKWQERMVGRLCALVHNFAAGFSKGKGKPKTEEDYMSIGKRQTEEQVVNGKQLVALMKSTK